MGTLRKPPSKTIDIGSHHLAIDATNTTDDVIPELSHSPLESPPMLKKKLRRLSSVLLGGSISAKSLPPQLLIGQNKEKKVKASDSNQSLDRSPSILKKEAFRTVRVKSAPGGRKVQFDNDVTVHMMDDEGHLCTQCKELNGETTCRKDFIKMHRQNTRRTRTQSLYSTNSSSPSAAADWANRHSHSTDPYNGQGVDVNGNQTSKPNSPQVNISFEQDSEQGTKLKFLAYLGREYQPDNILVKANMHGSRIRVLATRMVTMEDGRQVAQEFNERYALPMNVDPFSVQAKLDSKGYLTVLAPLMTLAKRQTLSPPQSPGGEE